MKTKLFILLIAMFSSLSIFADTVRIPIAQQDVGPKAGKTKQQVKETYGKPDNIDGPRGNPPIYYWEYSDFTVYFEGSHVIHTVSKYLSKPKN